MSSEKQTSFMSKNTLHELGVVATELRSIDPTAQVISHLNEAQTLRREVLTNPFPRKKGDITR
ncbi:MAG: hypothetical protein ACXAC2_25385 [Candidatus Kariarchaeaceae archaeon]